MSQKSFPVILLILLLSTPLAIQTCNAQPTPLEDKAMSFLHDVIQLDIDHYKISLTNNNTNSENSTSLIYKLEPNEFLSFGSFTMSFDFSNGTLTSFDIQPNSKPLTYVQPPLDRFNQTYGIMERFQAWINDPQVGAMADLMRKAGSEKSGLLVYGNLSLRIQQYSDVAQYSFCNYINGVEYTGISVAIGNSSGNVYFTDNRVSGKIGNSTIGISEDQAVAIAQNYVNSDSFRVGYRNSGNEQLANVNITGIRSVALKATPRIDHTWYPFYDVEFDINGKSAKEQGLGVDIGANNGENWGAHSYSSSTNVFPSISLGVYSIFALVVIVALLIATVILLSTRKRKIKPNRQ